MLPSILIPRFYKWIGLVVYLISFVYAYNVTILYDLDDVLHPEGLCVQIGVWLGLVLMLCARLKVEDEGTSYIRFTSLQWAVILFMLLRLSMKSWAFYSQDSSWLPQFQVNSLLLFYLILFYAQAYFLPWVASKWRRDEE